MCGFAAETGRSALRQAFRFFQERPFALGNRSCIRPIACAAWAPPKRGSASEAGGDRRDVQDARRLSPVASCRLTSDPRCRLGTSTLSGLTLAELAGQVRVCVTELLHLLLPIDFFRAPVAAARRLATDRPNPTDLPASVRTSLQSRQGRFRIPFEGARVAHYLGRYRCPGT